MTGNLVIVESPAKRKTIEKYLGDGWHVVASVGHIRDLPQKEFGIDVETFKPTYVPTERGQDVIKQLRQKASNADVVWLATDLDREGEAIAWHLKVALCLTDYKRIAFNEITKTAILEAIKNPGQIDMNKVNAQQGRRVLDRMIGYQVSPALSDATGRNLSAGRVQSPAVRLIREREAEIEAFVVTNHFGVELQFSTNNVQWYARWDTTPFVDEDNPYFLDKKVAGAVAALKKLTVLKRNDSKSSRNAPAPFITSTLQQAASVELKFTTDKTMKLAQELYEAGLISYMRTDCPNLSADAIADIRTFFESMGKSQHLVVTPNVWKTKDDNAQEAHEAIRPSSFERDEIELDSKNTEDARALYNLIRLRALACQMKPAVYEVRAIDLQSNDGIAGLDVKPIFKAKSRTLAYPGWLSITNESESEDNEDDDTQARLPELNTNDLCNANGGEVLRLKTKPPKRFTEASLVKRLEREGIGRPSTYAAIIKNILTRSYVKLVKRNFHLCEAGRVVVDTLDGGFSFVELEYTRNLESELDLIAQGKTTYTDLARRTYEVVCSELESLSAVEMVAGHQCGKCDRPLKQINGSNGPFWSCTGYQTEDCKQTYQDDEGCPYIPPAEPEHFCKECRSPLQRLKGKKGWYWRCTSTIDESCKYSMDDKNGAPQEKKEFPCPECCKPLIRRPSKQGKGHWWGCSGWKDGCKYTTDDNRGKPAEKHPCPNCDGILKRVDDKFKEGVKIWLCSKYRDCNISQNIIDTIRQHHGRLDRRSP